MKSLSILVFLLLSSIGLKSQVTYFNYLDYTAEWRVYGEGWTGFYSFNSYMTYYFDGDTLINGKSYYKQYITRVDSNFQSPLNVVYINGGPLFIREDSTQKFYQYDPNSNTEWISADWQQMLSLQVGDTFPLSNAHCPVALIDSMALGSRYLKHYHDNSPFTPNGALEGVGFLTTICGNGVEASSYTACFKKQNISLQFSWQDCSSFPEPQRHNTLFTGDQGVKQNIELFPIPASGSFYVRCKTCKGGILDICDMRGNRIISKKLLNDIEPINEDLEDGIYFFRIISGKGVIMNTGKIVICK